jgi:hypothetical protein
MQMRLPASTIYADAFSCYCTDVYFPMLVINKHADVFSRKRTDVFACASEQHRCRCVFPAAVASRLLVAFAVSCVRVMATLTLSVTRYAALCPTVAVRSCGGNAECMPRAHY